MRQIGAVMGVAIFSVAVQSSMVGAVRVHAREVTGLPAAAQEMLVQYVQAGGLSGMPDGGQGSLAAQLPQSLASGIELAMKRSFTDSVNVTFELAALIGLAAVLVSLLMAGARKRAVAAAAEAPRALPELAEEETGVAVGK
jgi:hypothetical protein